MKRYEAINILLIHSAHWTRLIEEKICGMKEGNEAVQALDMAIKALEQDKWIPVSERLPEKDGFYLVTVEFEGYRSTEICSFDEMDSEKPFCPTDALVQKKHLKYGYPKKMIVAWMPLPEPYKSEVDE